MESIKMFTTRRGFLLTTAGSAVAITLSVLGVNFIGDGLRDALDPKTVKRG